MVELATDIHCKTVRIKEMSAKNDEPEPKKARTLLNTEEKTDILRKTKFSAVLGRIIQTEAGAQQYLRLDNATEEYAKASAQAFVGEPVLFQDLLTKTAGRVQKGVEVMNEVNEALQEVIQLADGTITDVEVLHGKCDIIIKKMEEARMRIGGEPDGIFNGDSESAAKAFSDLLDKYL